MDGLTLDRAIDVASFAILFLLWSGFVVLSLKRTIAWDIPTRAVTAVLAMQSVREVVGLIRTIDDNAVPDSIRTTVRISIIVVAITAMIAVKRDRPHRNSVP